MRQFQLIKMGCCLLMGLFGLTTCISDNRNPNQNSLNQYHEKGRAYAKAKKFTEAIQSYRKAIVQYNRVRGWEQAFICKNQVASLYAQKNEYNESIRLAEANVLFCKQRFSSAASLNDKVAQTKKIIATAYKNLYQYDKALQCLREALGLYKKQINPYYREVAVLYNELGYIYFQTGFYHTSFEYHQKALDLLQTNMAKQDRKALLPVVAKTYNYLGMTYGERGAYLKAIGYYRKTLRLREEVFQRKDHSVLAGSYNNIGINFYLKKQYDSAQVYLKKAILIRERAMGKGYHTVAGFYNNLGRVALEKKNYAKSLEYFKIALKIRKKAPRKRRILMAQSHTLIGDVYAAQATFDAAMNHYHQALVLNSHQPLKNNYAQLQMKYFTDKKIFFTTLEGLANVLKLKGLKNGRSTELKNVLAFLQNVVTLYRDFSHTIENKRDKIMLNGKITQFCLAGIDVCYRLATLLPEKYSYYLQQAFYLAECNKASVLSSSLAEVNALKFSGIPVDLLKQEKELRTNMAFCRSRLFDKRQEKAILYRNKLFAFNRDYEQLIEVLEQKYPRYHELKYQKIVASIPHLQQTMSAQQVLLQYVVGNTQAYVFVITKEGVQWLTIPAANKLLPLVQNYYGKLQGGYALKEFTQVSHQVYQLLIRPVEKFLVNKTKLTIIPDWQLAKTSFGALVSRIPQQYTTFGDLDYLTKRFEINYHYSASLFGKKQAPHAKNELSFVAFAPFSQGKGRMYTTRYMNKPLPASKIEVNTVLNAFRQKGLLADAYLANEATKTRFLQKSIAADVVHIASHSVYDRTNENLARIYFAKEKGQTKDNHLLVGNIYNLRLQADLVVLSSCESGLGKSYKGEGMMSLTRSFLYAGAHNIIYSLWRVNDQYTKDLMVLFYQGALQQQYRFTKALQEAKKQLISQNKNLHPKHWSGFALIGQ